MEFEGTKQLFVEDYNWNLRDRTMILGGPKDTITPLWTKGLKALVPPNSFGPPPMGGVGVDLKDRGFTQGAQELSRCF